VIGVVNGTSEPRDVVVCAAGSMPGDLHKLWRTRDPKGYHVEYGYSCMGYEVAGGLGVKLADPDREVIVMVGDGSWLMMSSEIATSIQEGARLTVVLIDNHGFGSIGGLSRSLGSEGFGTAYPNEVDLTANARSLGAHAVRVETTAQLAAALADARGADRTTVIVIECDAGRGVGSYESWWDVPVAEVSTMPAVERARAEYERERARERDFTGGGDD
jgi:3D-(3,5/4)-trihydroxycyclohexane-1,2-dione acylhydrolase (decyclizing)